jgi:UDP-glucose 4-epimerase
MMKGKRVVVTGGAGFIGSHLAEKLLNIGAEVTIIDNFLFGSKIEHLRGRENLFIHEGDVRDVELVSQTFKDKDITFHLAAFVGVEEAQGNPLDVLDIEVQGTFNVLQAAVNNGIERVIFGSSSEVYGDSPAPMIEEGPLSPKSAYAAAKLVGEEYCKAFHQKYGIKYTSLRYFNVYGPRQDERFVIPRFVGRMLSHEPIVIHGDGNQTRDFTYVDDVVNMTLLAAIKPETSYKTINIGSGAMITMNDLARLVAKALDNKNPAGYIHIDYNDKRPLEIEVFARCADITRAKQLLQYEPEVSLQSGMGKYVDWRLGR